MVASGIKSWVGSRVLAGMVEGSETWGRGNTTNVRVGRAGGRAAAAGAGEMCPFCTSGLQAGATGLA